MCQTWNVFRLHTSVSVVVVCLFVLIGKELQWDAIRAVNMPESQLFAFAR